MDLRHIIAESRDLLANSLSPTSVEFMFHLLQKQMITPSDLRKHRELESTLRKTDDLIRIVCKSQSMELAREFASWLSDSGQIDLHRALFNGNTCGINEKMYEDDEPLLNTDESGESDCESLSAATEPLLNITTRLPTQPFIDDTVGDGTEVYPLSLPLRGLAVLVINSNFKSKAARCGSEYDQSNLSKVFTWLGFQVLTYSNITRSDLFLKLQTHTSDKAQRSYSSFVLCLLSHGGVGYVTMADDSHVYIDELIDRLDCNNFPAMAGKPKLLFIDCNNTEFDSDSGLRPVGTRTQSSFTKTAPVTHIEVNHSRHIRHDMPIDTHKDTSIPVVIDYLTKIACKADFILCHASFPRYAALHHGKMGSIATRVFIEVLYKHASKHHMADLAMKVRRKLCSKDLLGNKQVFTMFESLRKKLYLFPVNVQ